MANARELNNKIHSLANMQKVMRAMNMIATIKLRKLIALQESLKEFDLCLRNFARGMGQVLRQDAHPFFQGYKEHTKALAIVFTADKGLCGAHNNTVTRALDILVAHNRLQGIATEIACVGNKGANHARRKNYELVSQNEINERIFDQAALDALAERLCGRFLDGTAQQVYLVYNSFVSTLQQQVSCTRILPLGQDGELLAAMAVDELAASADSSPDSGGLSPARLFDPRLKAPLMSGRPLTDAIRDPDDERFVPLAGQLYFRFRLEAALVNSSLSEQAARMTAMENASNNSNELKSRYVTLRNRARQASITNELIEIISGKEALKTKKR